MLFSSVRFRSGLLGGLRIYKDVEADKHSKSRATTEVSEALRLRRVCLNLANTVDVTNGPQKSLISVCVKVITLYARDPRYNTLLLHQHVSYTPANSNAQESTIHVAFMQAKTLAIRLMPMAHLSESVRGLPVLGDMIGG
jgi:hypothetical protein